VLSVKSVSKSKVCSVAFHLILQGVCVVEVGVKSISNQSIFCKFQLSSSVTIQFCANLPVVLSNLIKALSVEEAGHVTKLLKSWSPVFVLLVFQTITFSESVYAFVSALSSYFVFIVAFVSSQLLVLDVFQITIASASVT